MIKTIPLVTASLKGFMRNWKSVTLLLVFPLLLVGLVFLSFNPNGLRDVPVGVIIDPYGSFSAEQIRTSFPYLDISEYGRIDACLRDLKLAAQYACIRVEGNDPVKITINFDDTREPIIWEIIERIKTTIDGIKRKKSTDMTDSFLNNLVLTIQKVEVFKNDLSTVNSELDGYISDTDETIWSLSSSRDYISNTLDEMDSDVDDLDSLHSELSSQRRSFYSASTSYLSDIQSYTQNVEVSTDPTAIYYGNLIDSRANSASNTIGDYNRDAKNNLNRMDGKIYDYRGRIDEGNAYLRGIDSQIRKLKQVKADFYNYKVRVMQKENELTAIQNEFGGLDSFDSSNLINPITIENLPAYRLLAAKRYASETNIETSQITQEEAEKGFSMVSLQTLFPTIFFVMVLFLSILVSNFVCLQNVNSPAYKRVKLVRGVFIHDFLSVYISSFLIIIIPVICMLIVGNFVFMIPIIANLPCIALLGFLLISTLILLGAGLAYLIKKESITLLVTTFFLIFLLFLSGFLYPVERMSNFVSYFALNLPSKIALTAFNKVAFYGQTVNNISVDILALVIWMAISIVAVLAIKRFRDYLE
ncbi:ABC transporter permease [Candidatus Woesearchaeota archaeon]|nr:ABC transporter permease [Candidatus Woesearchaeota archaeon]